MSKLYAFGMFLLVTNYIVGKVALPFFAKSFSLGMGIYLFSWIMLFAGLIICGKQGWMQAKAWYTDKGEKLMRGLKRFRRSN